MKFADRVIEGVRAFGPLCVGIDPHAGRIPDVFGGDTPEGMRRWGHAVVEVAKGRVCAVKPQVGLFERQGADGLAALRDVAKAAKDAGLIVLMDAKRGDIGSTAEGYAAAYLGTDAPFPCDALTVNPYMGIDTLEPYVREAEVNNRGVIVLVRTSNPGSADFQAKTMDGAPLYMNVQRALEPMVERLKGESGWSGLMMVIGATGPEEAKRIRNASSNALFLVPGYGAQGGDAADALAGFVAGPDGLDGGLVNASRSVTFPAGSDTAQTIDDWKDIVAKAIDAAQIDLRLAATQTVS